MRPPHIALIGMSNIGKTHWADPTKPDRLPSLGYLPYECDDVIEKDLAPWLTGEGYVSGTTKVARWLGQPYEPQYVMNSRRYLDSEINTMWVALDLLTTSSEPVVVSTTGSVYLTGKDVLSELRRLSTVVLLEAPEGYEQVLFEKYMKERKPVIWGDVFNRRAGEGQTAALERCYPELLRVRSKHYRKIAHKSLDYHELRAPGFTAADLLAKIAA